MYPDSHMDKEILWHECFVHLPTFLDNELRLSLRFDQSLESLNQEATRLKFYLEKITLYWLCVVWQAMGKEVGVYFNY